MRPPSYGWRWSLTTMLLVANVVVFVVQSIAETYVSGWPLRAYLGLSVQGLSHGFLWQPITFQFLHAGLFHLLGNCLVIYFFGRVIEDALGPRRFLALYFGSGVFGGLLQLAAALLLPSRFGGGGVVGASAGAFGLVASFATLFPDRVITLLAFLVLPISIRAKYFLWFEIALAIFGITVLRDNIAHVAHLGGIMVGFALTRWGNWPDWTRLFQRTRRSSFRPRVLASAQKQGKHWPASKAPSTQDVPSAEFISREVDPILEKISAHGVQSLTPAEKRILEAAASRIDRR
jgi:membrane associated rhomboid family serine protease